MSENITSLPEAIKKAIISAVGIGKFEVGHNYEVNEAGERQVNIWINSIWVIRLRDSYAGYITLAGVHRLPNLESRWYRCVMLIESYHDPEKRPFIGRRPLRAVELEFPDLITRSLYNANLLPSFYPLAERVPRYTIYTYTQTGFAYQEYQGDMDTPNMKQLWDAVLKTMNAMVEAYDDPEISALWAKRSIP